MTLGRKWLYRLTAFVVALLTILLSVFPATGVYAAQITSRSVTLQAGVSDGGSKAGGVVNHLFAFTLPTNGTLGSIQFLYCTTASGTCTTPTGLVTTSATMGSQTGAVSFTMVNTTNGAPYITRGPASITGPLAVSYQLQAITNPTTANQTFYVRISTFATANATGGTTDTGTVAASTATQISLTGTMPESLIFCAGGTVGTTGGVPDCTTATSGTVAFNQLFSPTSTATATSQMAASTNASTGYVITYSGATLTSGSNTIPAMTVAALGVHGSGQFGLNLKANTTLTSNPAVGTEVAPLANGTNFKGQAIAGYNTVDTFKFTTAGDSVANSANGTAGPSDAQIFTVSYIVNVSGSQTAGSYTTTLTYTCTATY